MCPVLLTYQNHNPLPMAALKEAPLSAAIAWSPLGGPYLAAGTAAGGIDASFSSASAVEVCVQSKERSTTGGT